MPLFTCRFTFIRKEFIFAEAGDIGPAYVIILIG
jgi:hypothetical protein